MSRDMESLYAGVKALVCVLKSNPFARLSSGPIFRFRTKELFIQYAHYLALKLF